MKRKRNINSVWHPIEEFYSSGSFPVGMVAKSRPLGRGALAPPPPPPPLPQIQRSSFLFIKDLKQNELIVLFYSKALIL